MNEFNYPIKYAVLDLNKKDDDEILYGNIVSKCYLIKSEINYNKNGNVNLVHYVVFPYNDFKNFVKNFSLSNLDVGNRIYPDDHCPINKVLNVYNNYEEAFLESENKNDLYKADLILGVSILDPEFNKEIEKIEDNYLTYKALWHRYEELINYNTKDMETSNSNKVKILINKSVK